MTWMNSDNLYLKFGTEKTTAHTAGEYRNNGQLREVEIKVTLTDLTATETILDDVTVIPSGARIAEVDVITHTAAATGTAIDVGLIAASDRSTEIDYNGLLAAFPTGSMNAAGETNTVVIGHTYVGALVGTTLASAGHISASRTDATAFTAGVVYIKIKYYMP